MSGWTAVTTRAAARAVMPSDPKITGRWRRILMLLEARSGMLSRTRTAHMAFAEQMAAAMMYNTKLTKIVMSLPVFLSVELQRRAPYTHDYTPLFRLCMFFLKDFV